MNLMNEHLNSRSMNLQLRPSPNILTLTGESTHIAQNFINLSVYASILCIFDPPKVQWDK